MVVKERRGRRRYIAFEVTSEELVDHERLLSAFRALVPAPRKPPKLVQFDGHIGIVRCELRDVGETRDLVARVGSRLGAELRTVSTSGTLHALRERLSLPEGERRGKGPRPR